MALPANFFRGATASPKVPTKNVAPPVTDVPFSTMGTPAGLSPSMIQQGFSLGGIAGLKSPSKLNATIGGVKLGYWILGGLILIILGAWFSRR